MINKVLVINVINDEEFIYFQIKFWENSEKNYGILPKYLRELLTILGFTTSLAFEGLNSSNMDKLVKMIEEKVKSSKNLLENDPLKLLIQNELNIQGTNLDQFTMSFGHRLALESFTERIKSNKVIYFKAKTLNCQNKFEWLT